MVSTTKLELASPRAQSARGIAALIQNAPRYRGRGRSNATDLPTSQQCSLDDDTSDDLEALFMDLMSTSDGSTDGLTLEMIFEWDEVELLFVCLFCFFRYMIEFVFPSQLHSFFLFFKLA
jgi:hypothetical protein